MMPTTEAVSNIRIYIYLLAIAIIVLLFADFTLTPAAAAVVATGQYDNFRDGANLSESVLNLTNVGPSTFGRLGSFAVDGEVRAQPLYMPSVVVNGTSTNVLFVATMHNSVYAFDATRPGSAPLWHINFGASVPAFYASGWCPNTANSGPELGILSTPVIDTTNGILYAVYTTPTGAKAYGFYIAAVDIKTGLNKAGSPAPITASVQGTGYDASGGTVSLSLNQQTYVQRPALAMSNGSVYVGLGSCGPDPDPYHGWVLGYSGANVSVQTSVYNSTPNGSEGAIWQSGRGLVVDPAGNVYASTGNGTNASGCGSLASCDASNSVIRFSPSGQPTGVYTDPNTAVLSQFDLDLSSSGPLYIGSTGLVVAAGKEGVMHVLTASAIGNAGAEVQSFQATKACGTYSVGGCYHVTSVAYWDNAANPLLYVWANLDTLRAYRWNGSQFNTTPDSQSASTVIYPGGILALSANGSDPNTGILWAMTPDNIMHAYQATNVGNEIYNTNQNSSRDATGKLSKFVSPTVGDGRVYVATLDGDVQVYGLLTPVGNPAIAGVQDAESANTALVPGAWTAIYGTSLAVTSRQWTGSDFPPGGALPTALDGVSVRFGGVSAAVYYVSPTQINVQTPGGLSGTVPVTVTLDGVVSSVFSANVVAQSPSVFFYSAGSNLYAASTHADNTLIGDPAVQPGTTKARAGETIVLYVNGLASSPSGMLIPTPVAYTGPVTVSVGSEQAAVTYAGLVSAGQFQVNITLPADLAAGNYPITVSAGGQTSPATVILPLQ